MDWDVITRYVLPPLLGGAGGFITIWANWGIEKQRQRLNQRRRLVADWRNKLIPLFRDAEPEWSSKRLTILTSSCYSSIRPHLSKDICKKFESERTIFVGEVPLIKMLNDEIGRIERNWKVV